MIKIPRNSAIIKNGNKFSSMGKSGGVGGRLSPGEGGFGFANAIEIPNRHVIVT
jgi:hypothetical protein